jgi:hypothetical protein
MCRSCNRKKGNRFEGRESSVIGRGHKGR